MKLNSQQLLTIQRYLDSKELTQVDLRNELIDHMANGIEKAMCTGNLSFQEAYRIEIKKWHSELADYSSLWIGWAWHGPKIMIKKCVKKTRQMYLRTTLLAMGLTGLIAGISAVINFDPYYEVISQFVGVLFFAFLAALLFLHLKMATSGYPSTYKYLFKISAVGVGFVYLLFNPLALNLLPFGSEDKIMLAHLFLYSYFTCYSYTFWDLYKSHRALKKLKMA